ncbi:hypothetical protein LGH82_30635 [Mesorhizobium sp. PAMC28654]|uniref:hypothetical protein n=1 Tax=Mesorhizobium sp. PAMC28654 TaxID=2880934 RepID=UPI001D0A30B9|nr:hypothetical protein [Mesorhizobium sp. PAMC28654]UDL89371.1 hypothetical protein LGH82_30635 [Mesorhizobium sp. PAMC28654]
MSTSSHILGRTNLNHRDFEPMFIEGEKHGAVHFFRNDQRDGKVYRAALWELTEKELPYSSHYIFANEETFLVVEGELEIVFEDGSKVFPVSTCVPDLRL